MAVKEYVAAMHCAAQAPGTYITAGNPCRAFFSHPLAWKASLTQQSVCLRDHRTHIVTVKTPNAHSSRRLVVSCANEAERTPPTANASPLVKAAWFGSEVFGNVVGVFRRKPEQPLEEDSEFGETIPRDVAVATLRKDYDRKYFVTGEMTMGLYAPDCEFADPFVSFRGRTRFKQNVSNLGSFMEEVNLQILDWQETEDKVATKWRFSCTLGLPWRPILASSGGTDHYFDDKTGRIYKHVEMWNISPADGVRQLFKPNPKRRTNSAK